MLYNELRPKNFDEMIGQPAALVLKNQCEQNKIAHSYLFIGERGTGKTTAAYILANKLGCNRNNFTLIEIDCGADGGVDNIRSIVDSTQYMSLGQNGNKVYILDEAHRMTKQAFDALLVTLETPPNATYFILCTTDAKKLPDALYSRCMKIIFKSISEIDLFKYAQKINKYALSDEVLKLLIKHSGGSAREFLSMFEFVAYLPDKSIDAVAKSLSILYNVDFSGIFYEQDEFVLKNKIFEIYKQATNKQEVTREFIWFVFNSIKIGQKLTTEKKAKLITGLTEIDDKIRVGHPAEPLLFSLLIKFRSEM